MKRFYSLVALSLLAGCAQPVGQVAAPATGAAPAGLGGSSTLSNQINALKAGQYHLESAADDTSIVVRYKDGHADKMEAFASKGRLKKHLELANTDVIEANSAADRQALLDQLNHDPDVEFAEPDYKMKAYDITPNDSKWSSQWDMKKIAMPTAWGTTKGTSSVKVAVVDTGANYNHSDLAGQIIKGHDFVNNDDDPMDDQGHGTHVSGTVAALMNNSLGVAGMAPGCKVLAVKVLGSDGSGDTSAIAQGIDYAVKQGAKVINMSLGGPQESAVLKTAVDNAVAHGVVVVVAAGNDGSTTKNYPAAYDNSLSVGASDQNDARAYFSTYGSTVDIAAPGVSILSTTKDGQYGTEDGTSMASPHVAAAAALVFSLHPNWTVAQVRQALESTGDAVSGFSGSSLKRLNVAKALAYGGGSTSPTPAPATTPAPTKTPAPSTGDTAAPTISHVGGAIGTTSAYVTWTTNEPADTQAEIGTTSNPTSRTAWQPAFTTSHKVTFSNLAKRSTYYFRLRSRDKAGNLRVSNVYRFTTRAY